MKSDQLGSASHLTIAPSSDHPAIRYAAEELARYLQMISGIPCQVATGDGDAFDGIRLGVAVDFPGVTLPAVADSRLDDALCIQVDAGCGVIVGNQPRSVLLAVYRYLRALGCRWVRPSADGEYLPRVALSSTAVHLVETPSYRHRALNLLGGVSLEDLREAIAWMPRVGLSGAFLEFDSCARLCTLRRQFTGVALAEVNIAEEAESWHAAVLEEVRKRDLLYHAKGHGWVYEALGLTDKTFANPLPAEVARLLAEIGGERAVTAYGADATNLCYSDEEARARFVACVVAYAAAHREVDFLHVWLADMPNNHCECPHCRPHRPADLYLVLLNELDVALTAWGLSTRIVFLAYSDLLWPPEEQTLRYPERFTLMFAPGYRGYNASFADVEANGGLPELPPYHRNALQYPREIRFYRNFLMHWQRIPHADGFTFDYHYWRAQYEDPGGILRARLVHDDIRALHTLGLNGLVGCYSLHSFYPSGLGLAAMTQTLWDADTSFAALIDDFFPAAYGPEWPLCLEYLQAIGRLCDPRYFSGEIPAGDPESLAALEEVPALIAAFQPIIARNVTNPRPVWAASWRVLAGHAQLTALLVRAFLAHGRGDEEGFMQHLAEARAALQAMQPDLAPALDGWLFSSYLHQPLRRKRDYLI